MADAIVSRLGQANLAGPVDELFLKVYAGEVITQFENTNVTMNRHVVKTITSGKSAQFPVIGAAQAFYHTPGVEILGGQIAHGERTITIDDELISPVFIAKIDEAKNHYETRSEYTREQGRVLARQMDKHVLQVGILAARSAATITGMNGGSVIYQTGAANFLTSGDDLAAALFAGAADFDAKDIPEDERVFYTDPVRYYNLVQAEKTINRDWGGQGAYSDGKVYRVAGIEIVKTNNLPRTNVANGTLEAGTGNKYAGDFSNTVGLLMHRSAVGTVKLLDLGLESEYQLSRRGTLMVASYAVGHGILRPDAAIEFRATVAP